MVVNKAELEGKIIPMLFFFVLTNTCAQICAQGLCCADLDCQDGVFRSSFLSLLDLTALLKKGGWERAVR